MKISILTYGHFASIFPLAKSLSAENDVTLYLMVHGTQFSESICSFNLKKTKNGISNHSATLDFLENSIKEYIGTNLQLRLVKYPNLKVRNIVNYYLSIKLYRYLIKNSPDIIHINGVNLFPFFIALLLRFRKIVWTIHDPILHSGEKKRTTECIYKLLCFTKTNLIIHNNHSKLAFQKKYPCKKNRIHYLPYAPLEVFQTFINKEIAEESETILFFGRISKYKGLEYLIEATHMSQKKLKNLKLIIAGTGEYQINFNKIKDNPLFEIHHRFISNEELVNFIQRSNVIICPYTDATQSGVIMTAFALLKPVIATDVGGIPEVVINNETGFVIPAKSAVALSNAINNIFMNPEIIPRFSNSIKSKYYDGEYSWNSICNQLLSIYNSVTKQYSY